MKHRFTVTEINWAGQFAPLHSTVAPKDGRAKEMTEAERSFWAGLPQNLGLDHSSPPSPIPLGPTRTRRGN